MQLLWVRLRGMRERTLRPDECVLRHVTRTSRAVVKAFDEALEPVGLTGGQFNVLMSLAQAGPLTVNALARHVGADPTTIPRALHPLKQARLVTSRQGRDRREHVIAVTSLGRRRLALARRRWTVVQRRILDAIGHPAWIALTRSMGTIRHAARARQGATAA
jgi:DNA-binding MarR family transcriptional regulator